MLTNRLLKPSLLRLLTYCNQRMMSSLNNSVSQQQIKQLEDQVPLVDINDGVLGPSTKRECHKRRDNEDGLLHRAFSVFLFNSKNELLLQQRSSTKVTFPHYYTNSCCSHPRYNEDELDEIEHKGIKCAAQRRMNFELGIPAEELPFDSFDVITRIHYSADSDEQWCEHEIDYIIICHQDVNLDNVNKDEVQNIMYTSKDELKTFLNTKDILITPWFKYITDNFLFEWWDNLQNLSKFKNDTIHRAGKQL